MPVIQDRKLLQTLSVADCIAGMKCIILNAKRLLGEGILLERNKSPTATFLYAISMEELSKAYRLAMVASIIFENNSVNWPYFWKLFTDHKFKQSGLLELSAVVQQLIKDNCNKIKRKRPDLLLPNGNPDTIGKRIVGLESNIRDIKSGKLEKIKWAHLYVDYIDNRWNVPGIIKDKDLFTKENVFTYLIDITTLKNQVIKTYKMRRDYYHPGSK